MVPFAFLLAFTACAQGQPPPTPLLEPNGDSGSPSISDDGKFVAFESRASNFVAGDQKDSWDVFLYERESGFVTRISDDNSLPARSPKMSGDGRWIAFLQEQPAHASPPGTWYSTEHPWKVGLHDRRDGSLRWIGDGTPTSWRGASQHAPSLTRSGDRIVFSALVNGNNAIRLYDTEKRELSVVTASNDPQFSNEEVRDPEISGDGRFLVFSSQSTHLAPVPELPNDLVALNFDDDSHVFRRDLEADHTEYVSHLALASIGYGDFGSPHVNHDGRFVAYDNRNPFLMGSIQIGFVSEVERKLGGRLVAVQVGKDEWQGAASTTWLSSNGRTVVVQTCSSSIPVIPSGCEHSQVVLGDLEKQSWTLVSRDSSGAPANLAAFDGVASQDQSIVAFTSRATNLVPDDSNQSSDIFLFEVGTNRMTRIVPRSQSAATPSATPPQTEPNDDSVGAQVSEDGDFVVFASQSSNFDEQDFGDSWDVFLLTCATGVVSRVSVEPHAWISKPAISGDGDWIVYWSEGESGHRLPRTDPWVLRVVERSSGDSHAIRGLQPNCGEFSLDDAPLVSRNGSCIAFIHRERSVDGSYHKDARLFDCDAGVSATVGLSDAAVPADVVLYSISAEAESVAFASQSISLAAWPKVNGLLNIPPHNGLNVFVRDLSKKTTWVANGFLPQFGSSFGSSCTNALLSEDGSRVAFTCRDDHFAANGGSLGFVADIDASKKVRLRSLVKDPMTFHGSLDITWLAPEGKRLLVSMNGEGVLAEPVARFAQVYLHELDSSEWVPISRSAVGEYANRPAEAAVASRDLSRIVFESEADNLVPGDTNNARDIFIVDRKTGKISRVEPKH